MTSNGRGLLVGLLACGVLSAAFGPLPARALSDAFRDGAGTQRDLLLSQTGQSRSDRVVGNWQSSSGAELTLRYTGRPETLMIQVYSSPGEGASELVYTARWINNSTFVYLDHEGARITGQVHASGRRISLRGAYGWSAEWSRTR